MFHISPGIIMMSIITNSYNNVVSSFFGAKFQRHIEEMLVSPTPNGVILAGYHVCGGICRGALVGMIVTAVASCFTNIDIQHMGIAITVVLLTAALFAICGFINAIFAKKFDDISVIPTFVLAPLTYLGGNFLFCEFIATVLERPFTC